MIGDKLKKDISDSVKSSVDSSAPALKTSGEEVGEKITDGVEEHVSKHAAKTGARVADDLGKSIGNEMGKRFNSSIGVKLLSAFDGMWTKVKSGVSTGVHDVGRVFSSIKDVFVKPEGDTRSFAGRLLGVFSGMWKALTSGARTGISGIGSAFKGIGSIFTGLKGKFEQVKKDVEKGGEGLLGSFGNLKKKLTKAGKDFKLGDLMFPLIAGLITALPSAIAFAGSLISSFVGFAVVALSALGPAIAGGALAGVAAMGSLKLSVGLFSLAMKANTPALADYKKRLESFKETIAKPIQEGMLSGFNAAMRISAPLVKSLTPMLREFGFNVGDIAINFAKMLSSAENMERLKQILTVNNDAVKLVGKAVVNLGQAFLILFNHLSPIILYLADGAKQLSEWAVNSIKAAEASGKLDTFISKTFNALTFFVGILVDFVKGIINVFHAAYGASGGMLTNLQGIAAKFKEWTGSDSGQAKMLDFFTKARIVTDEVLTILGKITKSAGGGLGNMKVDSILSGLKTLEGLGKPIADMFKAIRENAGGAWQSAFQNFAKVIEQLAQSGAIGTLAKSLSDFFLVLSKLLALPGVGQLIALAGTFLVFGKTIKMVWTILGPIFDVLIFVITKLIVPALELLAGAFGWPVVIIGILVAALVWFFTQTKLGRKIIEDVWNAIKTAIGAAGKAIGIAFDAVVGALKTAWNWITKIANDIWQSIKGAFEKVWSTVSTVAQAVWDVIKTVFTAVLNFVAPIWNGIFNVVKTVLTAIWDIFKFIFNAVQTVVEGVLDVLYQIWIRVFPILLLPLRIFEGIVILVWQGLVAAITWAVKLISSVVIAVWGAIWGFLQPIIQAIWDFIVLAWNVIVTVISTVLQVIWNVITTVWNAVWGFIQPILQAIWDVIVTVWNAIVGAISTALGVAWAVITTIWNAVTGFIGGVMSGIGRAVSAGWNFVVSSIQDALNGAWGFIQFIWGKITGFVSDSLDFLKGLVKGAWSALGDIGGGILSGLKSAVNTVIDGINWVIGGINGAINLANKLPGADIPTIPTIPHLAKGGIVSPSNGGTLALIAEAGKSERVEPLDENGLSKRDHAILNLISDGAGGGAPNVRVFIGDTELTSIVRTEVDKKNKNLASSLATGRKG